MPHLQGQARGFTRKWLARHMVRVYRDAMRTLCTFAALFAFASPLAAQEASPWVASARSTARFVAAGPPEGGVYRAGIEVRLNPKTITYWRDPGDAGVPPLASFEGSDNLAHAEMLYPAPRRIAEAGGLTAFGYEVGVLFPLHVTARDPARPVRLAVQFNYAACERICVPASASGELLLAPDAAASPHAAAIAAAEAEVPRAAPSGAVRISRGEAGWLLAFADASVTDAFAEGPEGWSFAVAPASGGFALTLAGRPRGAAQTSVPVRLTATGDGPALDIDTALDVPPPRP